jgi:hypothetical protein
MLGAYEPTVREFFARQALFDSTAQDAWADWESWARADGSDAGVRSGRERMTC